MQVAREFHRHLAAIRLAEDMQRDGAELGQRRVEASQKLNQVARNLLVVL